MCCACSTILYVRVRVGCLCKRTHHKVRFCLGLRVTDKPITCYGVCVKTFNTSRYELSTKGSSSQKKTQRGGNYDVLKRSSMRVHHEEVINGKRYKVLTVVIT